MRNESNAEQLMRNDIYIYVHFYIYRETYAYRSFFSMRKPRVGGRQHRRFSE